MTRSDIREIMSEVPKIENEGKVKIYRQGDVLLIETNEVIPSDAVEVPREGGAVVLAQGEVTGHRHAIADQAAVLLSFGAERWLRAPVPVVLRHEEHARIELPAATYRVILQREYVPNELPRQVLD